MTRLDIAADFRNLGMEDIAIKNSRQRRSGAFWGQDGGLETLYLGSSKSDTFFRFYDKTAKHKGRTVEPVTRIEAVINPHCSFKHIARINNPFEGLEIYKLSDLVADNRIPFSFCDSIHHRGLTATLKLLEPDERVEVKKLLNEHVWRDFPADEIFRQWLQSLKKLNPLKVSKVA